jgi:hypothetical protein
MSPYILDTAGEQAPCEGRAGPLEAIIELETAMTAILAILAFVVVIAGLNLIEFGRLD